MTDPTEPVVLPEHAAALEAYLGGQSAVAELRRQKVPGAPWPSDDNLTLAYLLHAAKDRFESGPEAGDLNRVLVWLAAPSWFEGALDRSADIAAAAATTIIGTSCDDAAVTTCQTGPGRHTV